MNIWIKLALGAIITHGALLAAGIPISTVTMLFLVLVMPVTVIHHWLHKHADAQSKPNTRSIDEPTEPTPPSPTRAIKRDRFLSANERFSIKGIEVTGLVYIGENSFESFSKNHTMIDPKAPIERPTEPTSGYDRGHYSTMTTTQRYQYLTWLSEGRDNLSQSDNVLMFMQGLEYYVLNDATQNYDAMRTQNLEAIILELHRFIENSSDSFVQNSASGLLCILYFYHYPERLDEIKLRPIRSFDNSAICYAIAKTTHETPSEPVDSDWLLHCLLCINEIRGVDKIYQHFTLARNIFSALYPYYFPEGVTFSPSSVKLKLSEFTPSLEEVEFDNLSIPDHWTNPLENPNCLSGFSELSEHTRIILNLIVQGDVMGALAQWPKGVSMEGVEILQNTVQTVHQSIASGTHFNVATIAQWFLPASSHELSAQDLVNLSHALANCDCQLVPDVRLTPVPLQPHDEVIVSRGTPLNSLSPEASWFALSIQLGSDLVTGRIYHYEEETLQELIELNPNEREKNYLEKFLTWQLSKQTNSPDTNLNYKERSQRDKIGKLLMNVPLSVGKLNESEARSFWSTETE